MIITDIETVRLPSGRILELILMLTSSGSID